MIWATVSSWSCFCWLYRPSLSLSAKNIISLISVLTIWWCPCVELSLVLLEEGCLLWSVRSIGKTLLACTPGFPVLHHLPELAQTQSIEFVMLSNQLILCHPLLLPSSFPRIRVFSSESALHIRWPKNWSFNFHISPSNEYSGLISFRMDWLDLLVVQGTLKSLLQHHSSKASILWCSAFFILQLSHPYMTTGKTITLARWAFV